jgi:hypothetical protein
VDRDDAAQAGLFVKEAVNGFVVLESGGIEKGHAAETLIWGNAYARAGSTPPRRASQP